MKQLLRSLARDRRGAAAAEMVLVMPLLLVIMFGSFELGNYFYNEHTLLKSVRDGARYAARHNFNNFTACGNADIPTPGVAGTVNENTKLIVQKGVLDTTAPNLLPNWATGTFSAKVNCFTNAGASDMRNGIYKNKTSGAPVVTVSATLPYESILGAFGFAGLGLNITATQEAAVAGI